MLKKYKSIFISLELLMNFSQDQIIFFFKIETLKLLHYEDTRHLETIIHNMFSNNPWSC